MVLCLLRYSGYFSRFKINKGDANDWDWNEVTTIAQCAVEYSPEVIADQNKYLLKFEVNTIKPLTKRQIRFYFHRSITIGNLLHRDLL